MSHSHKRRSGPFWCNQRQQWDAEQHTSKFMAAVCWNWNRNAAFKSAALCCDEFLPHRFAELLSIDSPSQTTRLGEKKKKQCLRYQESFTFCFGGKFHKLHKDQKAADPEANKFRKEIHKKCVLVIELSSQTSNWWSKLHACEKKNTLQNK